MVEIELADYNQKIQKLIDYFDLYLERNLDFDICISFRGPDQNYEEEKYLKDLLDELIKNESGWDKISASCRRMIICDRELDLEKGLKILAESLPLFNNLLSISDDQLNESKKFTEKIINDHKNKIYEITRYVNTCGLISYRSGDYSEALNFFELAECISRNPNSSLSYFVPDTTSNRIRTEFELFVQLLPDEIRRDYYNLYKNNLNQIIGSYIKQINQKRTDAPKDSIGYQIYGHGMASLHHNLGEAYSKLINRKGSRLLFNRSEFIKNAIEQNNKSLEYGLACNDLYRQLQSKRALSSLVNSKKEEYEEEVLTGRWNRGKLIIYQARIRNSKNKEDVKCYLNQNDFKLSANEPDKIGLLYNYNAIKEFLTNTGYDSIEITDEDLPLSYIDIILGKIEIAKKLKNELYLLYRREVFNLIRNDVQYLINYYWENDRYEDVVAWHEEFNCRSLIEFSQIATNLDLTSKKTTNFDNSIVELKKPIYDEEMKSILEKPYLKQYLNNARKQLQISSMDGLKHNELVGVVKRVIDLKQVTDPLRKFPHKHDSDVSLTLHAKPEGSLQNLILNYESILNVSTKKFKISEEKNVYNILINVLCAIKDQEETAVLKFIVIKQGERKIVYSLLIKSEGIQKLREIDFDELKESQRSIDRITKNFDKRRDFLNHDYTLLCNSMNKLSEKLELKNKLKDIKNLFIIPDGELYQFPLHLLIEDISNNNINIYYSPSLHHLLLPFDLEINERENNYLWIACPTPDLYIKYWDPEKSLPKVSDIKILVGNDATLESLLKECESKEYESNKYSHIGFFIHGTFHDHSIGAYGSHVLLNDSFLTPYDIIFKLKLKGIKTVFLGACETGINKYTDKNEAVGLLTAFLDKGVISVIAPIWEIIPTTYYNFISTVNHKGYANSPNPWNLSDIKYNMKDKYDSIPFVQYGSIALVVKRLNIISQQKIFNLLNSGC